MARSIVGVFIFVVVVVVVVVSSFYSGRDRGRSFKMVVLRRAIVVLGQQLHRDGMPRRTMKRRVECGVGLWKKATVPTALILSGARKFSHMKDVATEASAMVDIARCAGVDPAYVWKEERATNTAENALYVADLMSSILGNFSHFEQVTVVTSEWHVWRAKAVFEALLPLRWRLHVHACPDEGGGLESSDLNLFRSTLKDMAGMAWLPKLLEPSMLLWAYAARALIHDKFARPLILSHGGDQQPPSFIVSDLSHRIVKHWQGPCQRLVVSDVWINPPLLNKVCSVARIAFAVMDDEQLITNKIAARLTRMAPVGPSQWAVRLDCDLDKISIDALDNAFHSFTEASHASSC